MLEGLYCAFIITLLLIGASVIDDLRSRKVHNSLVTSIFVVSVWSALAIFGAGSAVQIMTSIVGAFAFCLPLYLMRAVGGGDLKLVVAISPLWAWSDIAYTLAFSLVWGALLGIIMVLLRKESRAFFRNIFSMALKNPVEQKQLHKIPYTIAILFGFLTHWSLLQRGVSLL